MRERATRQFAGKPACDCVRAINADLAERGNNTEIVIELFSGAVVIETMKADSRQRGKPIRAIASFCPFCGVAYARQPEAADAGETADA